MAEKTLIEMKDQLLIYENHGQTDQSKKHHPVIGLQDIFYDKSQRQGKKGSIFYKITSSKPTSKGIAMP
jgi:hypothetical protein